MAIANITDSSFDKIRISLIKTTLSLLQERAKPLFVEMELLFASMVTKRVHFYEEKPPGLDFIEVAPQLFAAWNPVLGRVVSVSDSNEIQWVTSPAPKLKANPPHWLLIDYKDGKWQGSFGLDDSDISQEFLEKQSPNMPGSPDKKRKSSLFL